MSNNIFYLSFHKIRFQAISRCTLDLSSSKTRSPKQFILAISTVFSIKPSPRFKIISPMIPQLVEILERSYENNDILIEICSLISIISNGCDISIHAFRNAGLKQRLIALLSHHNEKVITEVMHALRFMCKPTVLSSQSCSHNYKYLPSTTLISSDMTPPKNLSNKYILICENVEFFQVSNSEAKRKIYPEVGCSINIGQIGLRCIHCVKETKTAGRFNAVFPDNVANIPNCLNKIAFHFKECLSLPSGIREKVNTNEDQLTSFQRDENQDPSKINIVTFCHSLAQKLNILNRSPIGSGLNLKPQYEDNHSVDIAQQDSYQKSKQDQFSNLSLPPSENFKFTEVIMQRQKKTLSRLELDNKENSSLSSQFLQETCSNDATSQNTANFVQDGYGSWSCRHCQVLPFSYRAPGSVWHGSQYPDEKFVDHHLSCCWEAYKSLNHAINTSSFKSEPDEKRRIYSYNNESVIHSSRLGTSSSELMNYPSLQYRSTSSKVRKISHRSDEKLNMVLPIHDESHFIPAENEANLVTQNSQIPFQSEIDYLNQEDLREQNEILTVEITANFLFNEYKKNNRFYNQNNIIQDEDKHLVTDYYYHLMKQFKKCYYSPEDSKRRGGSSKQFQEVGFPGFQCLHCAPSVFPRKYFWSQSDRLKNSFSEVSKHMMRCQYCPVEIRNSLSFLKKYHQRQMKSIPRGSQRMFFRKIWKRLHGKMEEQHKIIPSKLKVNNSELSISEIKGEDTDKPNRRDVYSSPEKRMGINDVAMLPLRLGTKEDKYRLGETECFVRHSLEVFTANTKDDVNRLVLDHTTMAVKIGQVGLRCLSCYSKCSTGTMPENSVYYPRNILSINKAVRDFKRSHLHMCPNTIQEPTIKKLKLNNNTYTSKACSNYCVESAKGIGMYDTENGIRIINRAFLDGKTEENKDLNSEYNQTVNYQPFLQFQSPMVEKSILTSISSAPVTPLTGQNKRKRQRLSDHSSWSISKLCVEL